MNPRQLRALERRNKFDREKTISLAVVAVIFGLFVFLVMAMLVNTVLGDKGLVCAAASRTEFIQMGCK